MPVNLSQILVRRDTEDQASDKYDPRDPRYCYVPLTTADFRGRLAHLKKTDQNVEISTVYGRLNEADIAALRQEILDGPVAPRLRELVITIT